MVEMRSRLLSLLHLQSQKGSSKVKLSGGKVQMEKAKGKERVKGPFLCEFLRTVFDVIVLW